MTLNMGNRSGWEPTSVKAQLRSTGLNLRELHQKKDSQGFLIRKDIASLLQQRNIRSAREKAQKLIQEEARNDLMKILEMHIELLLERLSEIEPSASTSPSVAEAASSIVFAAPHLDSKDLDAVSHLLSQGLGEEFMYSSISRNHHYVAPAVIQAVTALSPSTSAINALLKQLASDHGIKSSPEPRRDQRLDIFSDILDSQTSPVVDLPELRRLCYHGLPDELSWLRPRIWRLLFGTLPVLKASWKTEARKQRESYYDLIHQLLGPFSALPPPSSPLAHIDEVLLGVSKQLSSIPVALFSIISDEPECYAICPLDDNAAREIKIASARNLDTRLRLLHDFYSPVVSTNEAPDAPEVSQSSLNIGNQGLLGQPVTFLPPESYNTGITHQKHASALLRLLYLHTSINPGNISPHVPSLLIPLYIVLNQEVEPDDIAHVEADAFWLFEAVVGEFSELEDEDGGAVWMKKFSERLAWADGDLSESLQARGLDPALPHYSYQWLAPLLSHTFPVTPLLVVWDALFSCAMRRRDINPKIDYLLDICTAMLIRARAVLLRLGKKGPIPPSLWTEENHTLPAPPPLRAWELGLAFSEGVSLLQRYPLVDASSIDRILQTASNLARRREGEQGQAMRDQLSLSARLKATMWKGFTNQLTSPDVSPAESGEDETDSLYATIRDKEESSEAQSSGLTSRLATTVWRGLTNQSSMEVPPSPASPQPPSLSPEAPQEDRPHTSKETRSFEATQSSSSLWGYAEKFRDSDTVATIVKVGSNWRAKTLLGSWARPSAESELPTSPKTQRESVSEGDTYNFEGRRGSDSLLNHRSTYSPPPRPTHFRSPRDSFIFPENVAHSPLNLEQQVQHRRNFMEKTWGVQSSLPSRKGHDSAPPKKSAPRPLLLSPSTSITSLPSHPKSRSSGTLASDRGEWGDILKLKDHSPHGRSHSSLSSLSQSDVVQPVKSRPTGWESDSGGLSRRVPLNRQSISPMAPRFRVHQARPMSGSSPTSSDRGLLSPPLFSVSDLRGRHQSDISEGPSLVSRPPISMIHSPDDTYVTNTVRISDNRLKGSEGKKSTQKTYPFPVDEPDIPPDSSLNLGHSRSPILRSKHYTPRPPILDIPDTQMVSTRQRPVVERKLSNTNSLDVAWPVEDRDLANTPRASSFNVDELRSISPNVSRSLWRQRNVSGDTYERHRKTSVERHEVRTRKISIGQRTRKSSTDNKDIPKRTRNSSAEEGDDEGYDDLLSAYESEEGSRVSSTL